MNRLLEMIYELDNAIKSNQYNPFRVANGTPTPGSEGFGHVPQFETNPGDYLRQNQQGVNPGAVGGFRQPVRQQPVVRQQQPAVTPQQPLQMTPLLQLQQQQRNMTPNGQVGPSLTPGNMTPMSELANIQMAQAGGMTPIAQLQAQQASGENPLLDMLTKKAIEDELGQWVNLGGQSAA